jgi:hypothetical protein
MFRQNADGNTCNDSPDALLPLLIRCRWRNQILQIGNANAANYSDACFTDCDRAICWMRCALIASYFVEAAFHGDFWHYVDCNGR